MVHQSLDAGWSQNPTDAGCNQSNKDAGCNQSNTDAGWNQSNKDAGCNQSNTDAGWNQSNKAAGWNQILKDVGWNQSPKDAGWNQSPKDVGCNQGSKDAGCCQSSKDTGWNKNPKAAGWNQNPKDVGCNQGPKDVGCNQGPKDVGCNQGPKDAGCCQSSNDAGCCQSPKAAGWNQGFKDAECCQSPTDAGLNQSLKNGGLNQSLKNGGLNQSLKNGGCCQSQKDAGWNQSPKDAGWNQSPKYAGWNQSPKDAGWSWMVLFSSFLLQMITIGVCLSSGLFIVEFMDVFGTSQAETVWIASMQLGVSYLIGAPISGFVCQRFSHRVSIVVGGLVLSGGLLASAFANSILHLYLTCGLMAGIGIGLIYSPSIGIIGLYFDRRLALALGITMAGGGCGSMLFSQIFYFLINFYFWRGALVITSALVLNCCALGALMFPRTAARPAQNCSKQNGLKQNDSSMVVTSRRQTPFQTIRALSKDIRFVLFFLNAFLSCFGMTAVFILLVDYTMDGGISPDFAAVLLSVTGLLSTVGRFMMAGMMQCLRSLCALHLYNASTVLCGVSVLLMPCGKSTVSFLILCSAFGFCYGGYCSSSPVVATQFFGAERLTMVYGYTLIASGLGCLLGSPVTGWIYGSTGNYDAAILFNGVTILLSFIVLAPVYCISCRRTRHLKLMRSFIIRDSISGCKPPLPS